MPILTKKRLCLIPRLTIAVFLTLALGFCGCTYSMQRAHKIKEDREVAAMVYRATVNDRVRGECNPAYEATWNAVFRNPDSAGSIVRRYCMSYPSCTSEVVRGGLMGVNVADDNDVENIVAQAAFAQTPSPERYMGIIDTAFSVVPYQGNAIRAGIEAAQAQVIDRKTGRPLKTPFIVFKEKPDLPWPMHFHAPYYVYVNPEGKGVIGGYAK
jgi:hypothetical protein